MNNREHCLEISEILNGEVHDLSGERLGRVDEVIVEAGSGRINWIRLDISAAGETRAACIEIPWSQFTTMGDGLTLDISHRVLKRVTERK